MKKKYTTISEKKIKEIRGGQKSATKQAKYMH